MKAIETRYLGPTDTRGGRIVATAEGCGRVTVPYDHALNADENNAEAARKLCRKMGWTGRYIGGYTARGMAWVEDIDWSPAIVIEKAQ